MSIMDFLNIFTPCLLMKTVNILSDYAGNEACLFHFCKHFMRRIWFGSATVEILSSETVVKQFFSSFEGFIKVCFAFFFLYRRNVFP